MASKKIKSKIEISNQTVIALYKRIDAEGIGVPDVTKATGIPAQRIYKWKQEGTNPKAEDEKIINAWMRGEVVEVSPNNVRLGNEGPSDSQWVSALLAEKDARRQDAERTISILERIINSGLIEIKSNLKEANESLRSIEAQQGVEHNVIMGSLDRLEKRKPGTLAAESGTLEHAAKDLKNKESISTPLDR